MLANKGQLSRPEAVPRPCPNYSPGPEVQAGAGLIQERLSASLGETLAEAVGIEPQAGALRDGPQTPAQLGSTATIGGSQEGPQVNRSRGG